MFSQYKQPKGRKNYLAGGSVCGHVTSASGPGEVEFGSMVEGRGSPHEQQQRDKVYTLRHISSDFCPPTQPAPPLKSPSDCELTKASS